MSAYVIAQIEITDPATYGEYTKEVLATITAHGGRFLVRGGKVEVLEGDITPKRVVVIEFPDVATLKRWYRSPEYQAILPLRKRASKGSLFLVEGAAA